MANTNGAVNEETIQEGMDELGRNFNQRANEARLEIVKQLKSAASTIRTEVKERADDDNAEEFADEVAKRFEQAANFLESRSVEELESGAIETVRNNPWKTMGLIFIVGLIIGILIHRD